MRIALNRLLGAPLTISPDPATIKVGERVVSEDAFL